MIAVWKHTLRRSLHGMTFYLFSACFLLLVGIGAMLYQVQSAVANFEYVLEFVGLGMAVMIPALTMSSFSEERRQKTDQLLYALPIRLWEIVLGKFLALLTVFLVPLAVICVYPLIFAQFGEVYLPASYGAILAFGFMNAAMLAIGIFVSSLTENQGFAAGIGVGVFVLNYYSVKLAEQVSATAMGSVVALIAAVVLIALLVRWLTRNDLLACGVGILLVAVLIGVYLYDSQVFSNLLPNIMKKLSLFSRFSDFVDGVFDLTHLVFYISVSGLFLFLTTQVLEKRRYN